MMKSARRQAKVQTQTSISLYIVAINTQKPKLKIQELGGGGSLFKVLTVHVKT